MCVDSHYIQMFSFHFVFSLQKHRGVFFFICLGMPVLVFPSRKSLILSHIIKVHLKKPEYVTYQAEHPLAKSVRNKREKHQWGKSGQNPTECQAESVCLSKTSFLVLFFTQVQSNFRLLALSYAELPLEKKPCGRTEHPGGYFGSQAP